MCVIDTCTLEKGLHVHVWVGSLACLAVNIIANLSLLIVAGLGLCNVCIGLSGNSIHTPHTHTHTHTHTQHVQNTYIHTYIQMYKRWVNGI